MAEKGFVKTLKGKIGKEYSKAIMFIYTKSRNNDFIYSSDLSEFLKVSTSRANQILNDFANMNLLKRAGEEIKNTNKK